LKVPAGATTPRNLAVIALQDRLMMKHRVKLSVSTLSLTQSVFMLRKKISGGVVHKMPADLKRALASDPQALTAWEDITPLARNVDMLD
jgi:hypothetical protein